MTLRGLLLGTEIGRNGWLAALGYVRSKSVAVQPRPEGGADSLRSAAGSSSHSGAAYPETASA